MQTINTGYLFFVVIVEISVCSSLFNVCSPHPSVSVSCLCGAIVVIFRRVSRLAATYFVQDSRLELKKEKSMKSLINCNSSINISLGIYREDS